LWVSHIQRLLDNYSASDADVKAELPLKQIWALALAARVEQTARCLVDWHGCSIAAVLTETYSAAHLIQALGSDGEA
jgi:hypothetical protein